MFRYFLNQLPLVRPFKFWMNTVLIAEAEIMLNQIGPDPVQRWHGEQVEGHSILSAETRVPLLKSYLRPAAI
jgi:hypothetical protein